MTLFFLFILDRKEDVKYLFIFIYISNVSTVAVYLTRNDWVEYKKEIKLMAHILTITATTFYRIRRKNMH